MLSIVYLTILVYLIQILNSYMGGEALERERSSVKRQFLFFLVSYITRLIFFIGTIIGFERQFGHAFWWQAVNLLMYIPWNILPIAYILWVHAKTYKKMLRVLNTES